MKPVARVVEEKGISVAGLVGATGLDRKLVEAIVSGNFTASPQQRKLLASALGVDANDISWSHAVPVEHLRGNGPQTGRTP